MTTTTTVRAMKIATLNDTFRTTGQGGRIVVTRGVADKGDDFLAAAVRAVQTFSAFEEGDDPYREHDFGAVTVQGNELFWKIDYYDKALEYGSDDPADPAKTTRVLTIMLSDEY